MSFEIEYQSILDKFVKLWHLVAYFFGPPCIRVCVCPARQHGTAKSARKRRFWAIKSLQVTKSTFHRKPRCTHA